MASETTDEIIHREIDTDSENPIIDIVEIVAEAEGKGIEELPTLWKCIDGILDEVFSTPPSPEANLAIDFSYEGYRITVQQDGHVKLNKIE